MTILHHDVSWNIWPLYVSQWFGIVCFAFSKGSFFLDPLHFMHMFFFFNFILFIILVRIFVYFVCLFFIFRFSIRKKINKTNLITVDGINPHEWCKHQILLPKTQNKNRILIIIITSHSSSSSLCSIKSFWCFNKKKNCENLAIKLHKNLIKMHYKMYHKSKKKKREKKKSREFFSCKLN